MIQRDIKGLSPQQINELQAPQSGFNAGTQEKGVYVPPTTPTVMSQILGLAQAVEPAVKKMQEGAFTQGKVDFASDSVSLSNSVDRASKLIRDSSWLTREGYSQGVKFQSYTEGQLKVQSKIAETSAASLAAGDTLEMFSQAIKPHLNELSKTITGTGMTGEGKMAAQDQLLTYVAAAQKQYQGAVEEESQRVAQVTTNQISASMVGTMAISGGDPAIIFQGLETGYSNLVKQQSLLDPVKAAGVASTQMAASIVEVMKRVDSMDATDIQVINGIEQWLSSGPAMQMTAKARTKALDAVRDKQLEVQNNQVAYHNDVIDEAEYAVALGRPIDPERLTMLSNSIQQGFLSGDLTSSNYTSLNGKLWALRTTIDKKKGDTAYAANAQYTDRVASGTSERKYTTANLQRIKDEVSAAGGDPNTIPGRLIQHGIDVSNLDSIATGAKLWTVPIMALLKSGSPAEIAAANDGEANENWLSFQTTYNALSKGNKNPELASALLDGITDPTDRATMGYVLQNEYADIASMKQAFTVEDGRTQLFIKNGDMKKVVITPDDIPNARLWGQFGGFATGGQAALGKGQSDEVDAQTAASINAGFQAWQDSAIRKGERWKDGKQAFQAYKNSGELVLMDYGYVPVPEDARIAMSGGKGVAVTPARAKEIMEAARIDMQQQAGDGVEFMPENFKFDFVNGYMYARVLDEDGVMIQETLYNSAQQDTLGVERTTSVRQDIDTLTAGIYTKMHFKNDPTPTMRYPNGQPIGVIRNGVSGKGFMEVYPDKSGIYGSNGLKEQIFKNIASFEGSVETPTATNPKKPDTLTVGNGLLLSTVKFYFGPNGEKEFTEAARDMTSPHYARLFDAFAERHFQALPNRIAESGLPAANSPKSVYYGDAYALIADTMWHRPTDAPLLANIYRTAQTDRKEALRQLGKLDSFRAAKGERKQFAIDTLTNLSYNPTPIIED
jgi:hypothetical protein